MTSCWLTGWDSTPTRRRATRRGAYASIFDRASLNEGFKGNLFTDALDLTMNISMRVRLAQKMVASLPADCREAQPQDRPEFKAFKDAMVHRRVNPLVPATPGLKYAKLPLQ